MFKLPIRTWVRNAAAVFSDRHGSVTEQAQDSQCRRETVYEHLSNSRRWIRPGNASLPQRPAPWG